MNEILYTEEFCFETEYRKPAKAFAAQNFLGCKSKMQISYDLASRPMTWPLGHEVREV